jgi:hypothetical protein
MSKKNLSETDFCHLCIALPSTPLVENILGSAAHTASPILA